MSTAPNIRRRTARPYALSYFAARIVMSGAIASFTILVPPQLRAQSQDSQQSSQDVAEAARQARARKQQAAAERHVYTNEDLRRGKILTREDQDRAAAANHKNSDAPVPAVTPETQPLDADSMTPQEPLGDVARRYRNAKKGSPFHLPSNQGALATPRFVGPIVEPNSNLQPPWRSRSFVAPKPAAPHSHAVVPSAPSLPLRMNRINPFVGRRTQPSRPEVMMVRPVEPRTSRQPKSFALPLPRAAASPMPSAIVVQPGDTLWDLSRRHLGRGTRWIELLSANPAVEDPARLLPGTQITLPVRIAAHRSPAQTVTIQSGDSLSKLALATYGHASYWPCLASANPTITNPHQLHIGLSVTLPASCTP